MYSVVIRLVGRIIPPAGCFHPHHSAHISLISKFYLKGVNPCFLMSNLISHLSYTSCDVRVKSQNPEQINVLVLWWHNIIDPYWRTCTLRKYKCLLLPNECTAANSFCWLYLIIYLHTYYTYFINSILCQYAIPLNVRHWTFNIEKHYISANAKLLSSLVLQL